MFRKEGTASSTGKKDAPLRKSDKRKIRDRVLTTFPYLIGEGGKGKGGRGRGGDDGVVAVATTTGADDVSSAAVSFAANDDDDDDDDKNKNNNIRNLLDDMLAIGSSSSLSTSGSRNSGSCGGSASGGGDLVGRKLSRDTMLFLRTSSSSSSSPSPGIQEQEEQNYSSSSSFDRCDNNMTTTIPSSWPYREMTQPILIEMECDNYGRKGKSNKTLIIIPCLSFLSIFPTILPIVIVPNEVSKFLCRGADLMKSGIIQIIPSPASSYAAAAPSFATSASAGVSVAGVVGASSSSSSSSSSSPSSQQRQQLPKRGDVVSIIVKGNIQPFAVGFITEDVSTMRYGPGTKGVAVQIIHCYGDDLWKIQVPPTHYFSRARGISKGRKTKNGGSGVIIMRKREWDDGNYGNPGFIDGIQVLPILNTAALEDADEGGDDDDDGDVVGKEDDDKEEDVSRDHEKKGPFLRQEEQSLSAINNNNTTKEEGVMTVQKSSSSSYPDADKQQSAVVVVVSDEVMMKGIGHSSTCEKEEDDENKSKKKGGEDDKDDGEGNDNNNNNKDNDTNKNDNDNDNDNDALLLQCFYKALNTTVTDKSLPMPTATFFGGHLLPSRPVGTTINMKQTRYKKIGTFLLEQVQNGLIDVSPSKDGRDKTAFISKVNRSHPDLRANKRMLKEQKEEEEEDGFDKAVSGSAGAAAAASAKPTNKKLAVVNLYRIPTNIVQLMKLDENDVMANTAKSDARRGTGFLTASECKSILVKYITNIIDPNDPSLVILDGPLCDALWKLSKKEQQQQQKAQAQTQHPTYPTKATRKEIQERWMNKMENAHAIVAMPGNEVLSIKRGDPNPILIEVERRQGKKYTTRIRGLEEYGIDGIQFANDTSKRFACASTVEKEASVGRAALKKNCVEIVLQGNLLNELKALLTGDENLSFHGGSKGGTYFIPKCVIKEKLGKGVPSKKKKKER